MKDRELKLTNDRKNRMVLQRTSPKKQQSHMLLWVKPDFERQCKYNLNCPTA